MYLRTEHIASLDLLRGLAALAVVVWHWRWFFSDPVTGLIAHSSISALPFRYILYPAYSMGYLAVDLFFAISGFIFFHMYRDSVTSGQISSRKFCWNRFTRLYPLHIVTLLIVAAAQPIYHASNAAYFVYPDNSLAYFALQFFMASNWMPGTPYSFNGPIWSLSIEILLYALFYVLARRGLAKPWCAVLLVLGGSFLIAHANMIGRGVMAFYIGALCYFVVRDTRAFKAFATAIIGAAAVQAFHRGLSVRDTAVILIGIPAIILAVTLNERRLSRLTSNTRWLGNISYSSYLLHFPIALVLMTIGVRMNSTSHVHIVLYLSGVTLLSLICFHWFERPAQKLLRNFGETRKTPHPAVPQPADRPGLTERALGAADGSELARKNRL